MGEVLPLKLAARRFRVPSTWLKAEAEAGRVPCLRAGRQFLFDIEWLTQALRERIAEAAKNGGRCDA